ncbi:hypothetical protein BpHYR1_042355 [Brachionus plicatilis]|uniref:Uncharacterized protein n=1 Tax=Brachionus plicatilis TaxID=10195 RepID=A0A3M7SUV6_BRAPC|nr:hypothetical protein BpHYR1_042355 [Brachionus plicatilis]
MEFKWSKDRIFSSFHFLLLPIQETKLKFIYKNSVLFRNLPVLMYLEQNFFELVLIFFILRNHIVMRNFVELKEYHLAKVCKKLQLITSAGEQSKASEEEIRNVKEIH